MQGAFPGCSFHILKSTENQDKLGNFSVTHEKLAFIWGRVSERKRVNIFQKYFGFGLFTVVRLLFLI